MLSLTKLLTGDAYAGDALRYTENAFQQVNGVSEGKGPVVAWNYTRSCNLHCRHCYSRSENRRYDNELSTEEALRLIDDLAEFHVPALLFSGGEPLCRRDFPILARHAAERGIRVTLSTNGTLISPEMARTIKDLGVSYVGISLDGMPETNDRFRGQRGAFDKALAGVRHCRAVGQRVGFRFTLNRHNVAEVPAILDLMEQEDVDRICFYHLVYSGRGSDMRREDLSHEQTREALDLIIRRTLDFHGRGLKKEVLMVDNHADGPYLYLKYRDSDPQRAAHIYGLLRRNGGNRSGMAFGDIDSEGNVHPDQFTREHTLGNVRQQKFGDIWTSRENPLLDGLKDRQRLLPETCRDCTWLSVCNGNFRARAEAVSGDFWGFDPACYLTPEERTAPAPEMPGGGAGVPC